MQTLNRPVLYLCVLRRVHLAISSMAMLRSRLGALARNALRNAAPGRAALSTMPREPTVVGLKFDPNSREVRAPR